MCLNWLQSPVTKILDKWQTACRPWSDTTFCGVWTWSTQLVQACLSKYSMIEKPNTIFYFKGRIRRMFFIFFVCLSVCMSICLSIYLSIPLNTKLNSKQMCTRWHSNLNFKIQKHKSKCHLVSSALKHINVVYKLYLHYISNDTGDINQ